MKNRAKKDAFAKIQLLHVIKRCLSDKSKEVLIHVALVEVAKEYMVADYDCDFDEYYEWQRNTWEKP